MSTKTSENLLLRITMQTLKTQLLNKLPHCVYAASI